MGKAKKLRSTSHKKQVPPTGGLSLAQLEVDDAMDYSTLPSDEAELFHGVRDCCICCMAAACYQMIEEALYA